MLARLRDNDPDLVELYLSNKGVGDDGATAIAEVLKTNNALQTLNLGDSNLGDAGAAALFGSGAALRKLRLSFNGITTVPATVRGLTRLEEMHLDNNKLISADGIFGSGAPLRVLDLRGGAVARAI